MNVLEFESVREPDINLLEEEEDLRSFQEDILRLFRDNEPGNFHFI